MTTPRATAAMQATTSATTNAAIASATGRRALASRAIDDVVLFGGAAGAVLIGFVVWRWPVLLPWLFWAWLLLIDGPHLLATGLRSWADGSRREVDAVWRRRAWIAFAVPFAAWLLARFVPQAHAMDLLLGVGALLSWHHMLRQNEGIHAILAAQQPMNIADRVLGVAERRWMVAWLWLAFAASAVWTPANRSNWGVGAEGASVFDAATYVLLAAMAACIVMVLRAGLERRRLGRPLRPWLFACFASGGLLTLAALLIGWAEPVHAPVRSAEQMFMAVTLVVGFAHGTQYLLVALASHRHRTHAAASWLASSAHRPVMTLAWLGLASFIAYGAINALKGTLPGVQWADESSPLGQAAIALYWGVFFHHYYVDRYIWRIRSEPSLRDELGLAHG
jgi:hypothetical protein